MMPERKYKKPPVIEALCEIYFADSTWDDTIPGLFYEQVKVDFPIKRQRKIQQAEFALGPDEAKAGLRQLPPWMQFVSDEKHRMLQIAQNLLVVNQLPPYPHFEEWELEVVRALGIYKELALPKKVERLGLRYMNRVAIPGERIRMEEYFTIYPNLPSSLGDTHGPFMVGVEIPQPAQDHTLLIRFSTAPAPVPSTEPAMQTFMLDFYDVLRVNRIMDEIDFEKEIRQAHRNIVMAFEGSITDLLRELFELEDA